MAASMRIYQIQALRFLAAAMVMWGHVQMVLRDRVNANLGQAMYALPWGIGVDIFFIISGFIIFHVAVNVPNNLAAAKDFMIKRIVRIVPLYWLFTGIAFFVKLVHDGLGDYSIYRDLFRSLFFIPYGKVGEVGIRPLLAQGWTLDFEMFFYVMFSFLIVLFNHRIFPLIAILLGLALSSSLIDFGATYNLLFSPLLLLFAIGAAIRYSLQTLPKLGSGWVVLVIFTAVVWVLAFPEIDQGTDLWSRLWRRGVPSALVFLAFASMAKVPMWLRAGLVPSLGDASYALYLSHPFVIHALISIGGAMHLPMAWGFAMMSALLCVVVSLVIHVLIERPMLRFFNRVV